MWKSIWCKTYTNIIFIFLTCDILNINHLHVAFLPEKNDDKYFRKND